MPSFCCFLHPKYDSSIKDINDLCPECGLPYSFPLSEHPETIDGIQIQRSLDRGFYGATYLGLQKPFDSKVAVKVVPKILYQFFNKNFEEECRFHHQLSENSDHFVRILNMGECPVKFGERGIECHFAVMEFVNGRTLKSIIEKKDIISPRKIAQITLDLYQILNEFIPQSSHRV